MSTPEGRTVFDAPAVGPVPAARTSAEKMAAGERLISALRTGAPVPEMSADHWSAVVDEALRHKIAPLLYHRLRNRAGVPPLAAARLREIYARAALRAAVVRRDLSSVLDALAGRSIPCMALKGVALVLDTYAEPALRSMADIDVLVPRDRLADAERALLDAGWGSEPRPDIVEYTSWCHHIAPLDRPGGTQIEVHWTIERPSSPFRIDIADVWTRARPSQADGRTLVPAPEDMLLHTSLHAAYHHRFDRAAFKHLCDVAAIVEQHAGKIDWDLLTRISNECAAGTFVRCTLRLANEVLGVAVPDRTLRRLERTGDEDAIVRAARNYIVTPPEPLPSAYDALARRRTLAERVKLVGETMFPGRAVIASVHGLDRDSWTWVFYAAWRPFDLLIRRGSIGARILLRSPDLRPVLRRESDRRAIYRWIEDADAAGEAGLHHR